MIMGTGSCGPTYPKMPHMRHRIPERRTVNDTCFHHRLSNTFVSLPREHSMPSDTSALGDTIRYLHADRERIALMQPRSLSERDFACRLRRETKGAADFRTCLR